MNIEDALIKPYSVISMVGPTSSGKSTWTAKLKTKYPNLKVLSSDQERAELLGVDLSKMPPDSRYSQEMLDASASAFSILFSKLDAYCRQGFQHILIDSTGTKMTTGPIGDIADRYGYEKVAFTMDLSNTDMASYAIDPKIFNRSLKTYKKESLKSLKGWKRCNIKSRDSFPILVTEEPLHLDEFCVVGDLHQELEKTSVLLDRLKGKSLQRECPIIFIGDYFDEKVKGQGGSVEETLTFLEEMVSEGNYLLKGNHENYINYRIEGGQACPIEKDYFNSVEVFLSDESLKERFVKLFEVMADYIQVISKGKKYQITHAPSGVKYRCKPHKPKYNFKWSLPEDLSTLHQSLSFINDGIQVTTIHGHVHHNGDTLTPYRDRYFIDTGASMGGALTGVYCSGRSVKHISIGEFNKDLPSLLPPKEVSPEVENKINRILDGGSKFISGTMSPAPSFNGELESLEGALKFFKKLGIEALLLDKKHMGSRCNAYIKEDHVLFTSRSGLPIRESYISSPLDNIVPELQEIRQRIGCKELILDGELMPWSCLGEMLVKEYQAKLWVYQKVKELGMQVEGVEETKEILNNFSSMEKPYLIPFSILMIDWGDERGMEYPEWDWETYRIKMLLGEEDSIIISSDDIETASNFFQEVVNKGMEGIVIKPLLPEDKAKIPYMKVRGRDYLRLVYGPNWMNKESMLAATRNINKKVDLSVKEWHLGKQMISSSHKYKRRELMVEMLGFIDKESLVDPRL